MDDVFGEVLIAAGDEDFAAGDVETAVGLRFCTGADDAQVGARMGLGQAHRTGPATFIHRRQVQVFQRFAGVGINGQASARAQGRVQREAGVGPVEHFFELDGEHLRHAHAAEVRVTGKTDPATFDVGGVGFFEAGWRADLTVEPLCAFLVAAAVERGDQLPGDLCSFFENGVRGGRVDDLGQGWQARPQGWSVEHFLQNKAHVAQWGVEFRHNVNLVGTAYGLHGTVWTAVPLWRAKPRSDRSGLSLGRGLIEV